MARLGSWLSADLIHALGWTLIHSLWQCLGLAALAALLMGFSRRPPLRYLVAMAALIAMVVAPATTFLLLMKPVAPAPSFALSSSASGLSTVPATIDPPALLMPGAAMAPMKHGAPIRLVGSQRQFFAGQFLAPNLLPLNILPWLVRAWLCGVALFSLRFAGGFLLLEYKSGREFRVLRPSILAVAQELQHQLGLSQAIQYLECGWLQAPAVIGWLRPIILLPLSALTGLTEMQLRAVIAHELAHISRLDAFANLLQILAETLLFYHPAIWWLNRRIRLERELCCDEVAVSLTGNRLEYAKAITLMAEWETASILAMAANRGPLSHRIFHILGRTSLGAGQRLLGLAVSLLFLFAAMGGAGALLGTAYPSPMTHAKARLNIVLSSRRATPDHGVAQLAPASRPADAVSSRADDRSIAAAKTRTETLVASKPAERLTVPSPDLSRLLPAETPIIPVALVSNDPSAVQPAAMRARTMSCTMPAIADQADLKEVTGSGLVTVPVEIDGRPEQFLLDIGTRPSEISQAAVAELGLPDADDSVDPIPVAVFEVKGGADDYRRHVRIASFTVGDATGHHLAFAVAKDPQMGKSKPYDGVMTGNLFKQYDVELDFARNRLAYLTPTSCTDPDQVAYWPHAAVAAIPITNRDGKIQVEVSILGQAIPAVIDTTSPHTVMRRDIAELMLGLKTDTPEMTPDGDVRDGAGLQVYRHIFPQIAFPGGVTAYNVPALIQTSSMVRDPDRTPILGSRAQFVVDPRQQIPALTLGMDVLHQLHLYIVQGQQKLYATPAEPPSPVEISRAS